MGQKEARELRQEKARESRQEEAQESRQEEARESRQEEARESKVRRSSGVTSHTPESVRSAREHEVVNPYTPKATPILGDGIPEDSQNFRE